VNFGISHIQVFVPKPCSEWILKIDFMCAHTPILTEVNEKSKVRELCIWGDNAYVKDEVRIKQKTYTCSSVHVQCLVKEKCDFRREAWIEWFIIVIKDIAMCMVKCRRSRVWLGSIPIEKFICLGYVVDITMTVGAKVMLVYGCRWLNWVEFCMLLS